MGPGRERDSATTYIRLVTSNSQTDWKQVPGYSNYEAHPDGRLRRRDTKRILGVFKGQAGKLKVSVFADSGEQTSAVAARLIAATFVPGFKGRYTVVLYKDGDITNIAASNLVYTNPATVAEKTAAVRKGPRRFGVRDPRAAANMCRRMFQAAGSERWRYSQPMDQDRKPKNVPFIDPPDTQVVRCKTCGVKLRRRAGMSDVEWVAHRDRWWHTHVGRRLELFLIANPDLK